MRVPLVGILAVALPFAVAAQSPRGSLCEGPAPPLAPSRDLYCLELIAAPGIEGASGRVELGRIAGPFTIAVTADGRPAYAPTFSLAGLPAPAALGPYATYVAWAATPVMYPVVRLGPVGNGRTRLAAIDLDKFVVLVTAEPNDTGAAPAGRVVLRGQSPSTRLQPPDLLQFSLGATRDTGARAEHADAEHAEHAEHTHHEHGNAADTVAGPADAARWTSVPMPAGIPMLPAEMALRPRAEPYLPRPGPGAAVPDATPRRLVRLTSGDTLHLSAGLVRRRLGGRTLTMYGFNGQYPGPLLEVRQGAEVVVDFTNRLDQPSTVHWHGIRLDNRFDGVPDLTQRAVPPGGRFTYRVRFPDAGVYWYHPHVREDAQQDLGLYGNLMVRSPRADYYGRANREEVLMLDDLLLGAGGLVPFGRDAATHALMGRFGNVFLVNGEPDYHLRVKRGEVVRFFLTNAANTRTFNVSFAGARMKVVAGDAGNYEREEWVESAVIAPAERYVVHVRFDRPGRVALVSRVQALDHLFGRFVYESDTLGVVDVSDASAAPDLAASFARLRADGAASAEIDRYRTYFDRPPDKSLVLTIEPRALPFLTRQLMQLDSIYFTPVEWSGTMPSMNWAATADELRWVIRDPATGKENMDIGWSFTRGDVIKLRVLNERRAFHAMQHPIHLHGQRFLVLAVNGVPNTNLVWKDTVLIPVGSTADLLVELSNPGRWMLHCHIAEHLSADMMMAFTVK